MKNSIGLMLLFIASLCIQGCKNENKSENAGSVKSRLKSAQIVNASNKFCFDLLKSIQNKAPDTNLFISPFSALEALSMAYNGAEGSTKDEMAGILGFTQYSDKEINDYNQSLTNALVNADEKVNFEVANSIWYRQGFQVLQSFLDVNHDYYNAEVNQLDFNSPDAVTTINNWVDNKTNDKIKTIINQIPEAAMMYLINAIYFKGAWEFEFDSTKSIKTDFFLQDGSTVQQTQMSMEAKINYYNNNDFQVVELPYGEGTFNFIIVLPNAEKNIKDVVSGLTDSKWVDIINSMSITDVVVKMPKFKFELNSLLNGALNNLGMVKAFIPDSADFSGIDGLKDLYISRVIHKTYIDLNEQGTEAAAVTAIEIFTTSAGENEHRAVFFTADKPFIYAITEKSTGAVLFIGKMMNPTITKIDLL